MVSVTPELPENWTDTRETLLEGMAFQLKYLGVTLVEQPKGEELSAAAVKRIVATVRSPSKSIDVKLPKFLDLVHAKVHFWRHLKGTFRNVACQTRFVAFAEGVHGFF